MLYVETLQTNVQALPFLPSPSPGGAVLKKDKVETEALCTSAWFSCSQTCRAYSVQRSGTPELRSCIYQACGQATYSFCTFSVNRWCIPHTEQGQNSHSSFLPPSSLCLHAELVSCWDNFKHLHFFYVLPRLIYMI